MRTYCNKIVSPLTLFDVHCAKGGAYEPALAVVGFGTAASWANESSPPASPLLGFAMDGRKLYGPYDATGALAWGLDACNGRWEVDGLNNGTSEAKHNALYTYRATPSFPYLVGCSGPAGMSLESVVASGTDHAAPDGEFVVGHDFSGVCPAGSYLSVDTGECEACHAGTYGKDAGLVGRGCTGVSVLWKVVQPWNIKMRMGMATPVEASKACRPVGHSPPLYPAFCFFRYHNP